MGRNSDILLQHAGQMETVFMKLAQKFNERGINSIEVVDKLAQPEGEDTLDRFVDDCDALFRGIADLKKFFSKDGPVKFWFSNPFSTWILAKEFQYITKQETIQHYDISRTMTNLDIERYLNVKPFTSISDVLSILYRFIIKQANGEAGHLLTNGCRNVFYLEFTDGTRIVVMIRRRPSSGVWRFHAYADGYYNQYVGTRVFSRS